MASKEFDGEFQSMKQGLTQLERRKLNAKTYRASEHIAHLIEIQKARIDSFKMAYRLAYNSIKNQEKLK